MLVAIYASRVFVAPADLINLFLFPSHDLTYVPNVFSLRFDYFLFLFVRYPSWLIRAIVWAIGLVEQLCGCMEFA
jgi:hypothetical protein